MFVEQLLPKARERLVTIRDDAPLIAAAKLLGTGVDLVIVCEKAGVLAGVITKTDVVAQISQCDGSSCMIATSMVMSRDVALSRPADLLSGVWALMKTRSLKNIPIVDQNALPLGLLNARDILQALLSETQSDENLLRDYVMGVGYR